MPLSDEEITVLNFFIDSAPSRTTTEIAGDIGTSKDVVTKGLLLFRKLGVKIKAKNGNRGRKVRFDTATAVILLDGGASIPDIANHVGATDRRVKAYFNKIGKIKPHRAVAETLAEQNSA